MSSPKRPLLRRNGGAPYSVHMHLDSLELRVVKLETKLNILAGAIPAATALLILLLQYIR